MRAKESIEGHGRKVLGFSETVCALSLFWKRFAGSERGLQRKGDFQRLQQETGQERQ